MVLSSFSVQVGRQSKWLQPKPRRQVHGMALPMEGSVRGRFSRQGKVFCDPRMPDTWSEITV